MQNMNPTDRLILACIVAIVVGSIVNMAMITIFSNLIAAPEGVDIKSV